MSAAPDIAVVIATEQRLWERLDVYSNCDTYTEREKSAWQLASWEEPNETLRAAVFERRCQRMDRTVAAFGGASSYSPCSSLSRPQTTTTPTTTSPPGTVQKDGRAGEREGKGETTGVDDKEKKEKGTIVMRVEKQLHTGLRVDYVKMLFYDTFDHPRAVDIRFDVQDASRLVELINWLAISANADRRSIERRYQKRLEAMHERAYNCIYNGAQTTITGITATHLLLASLDSERLANVYADIIYGLDFFYGPYKTPVSGVQAYLTLFCIAAYIGQWQTMVRCQFEDYDAFQLHKPYKPHDTEDAAIAHAYEWARTARNDAPLLEPLVERERLEHADEFPSILLFPRALCDETERQCRETLVQMWLSEVRFCEDVRDGRIYLITMLTSDNDKQEFLALARHYECFPKVDLAFDAEDDDEEEEDDDDDDANDGFTFIRLQDDETGNEVATLYPTPRSLAEDDERSFITVTEHWSRKAVFSNTESLSGLYHKNHLRSMRTAGNLYIWQSRPKRYNDNEYVKRLFVIDVHLPWLQGRHSHHHS